MSESSPIKYLNPLQLADLCSNQIIPALSNQKQQTTLKQNESDIRSIIMNHDIDCWKALRIDVGHFAEFFDGKMYHASRAMWEALAKKLKEMKYSLTWQHIVNVVKHEMNNAIAQNVSSVHPELKPLGPKSGNELISAIKTKTKRILTAPEEQYLRALIKRATDNITLIPFDDHKQGLVPMDFSPKWPGLNMKLIRDIFNTHKVFIFGAFNCSHFGLEDFLRGLNMAEKSIFGGAILSTYITDIGRNGKRYIPDSTLKSRATLFPKWLIHDDIFEVFRYHFAVSQWVDHLKCKDIGDGLDAFCFVIPNKVVSLYDRSLIYKYSINDIKDYLDKKSVNMVQIQFERDDLEVVDIVECLHKSCDELTLKNELIVFLIDRRDSEHTGFDTVYVIRCDSINTLHELRTNQFMGMHFNLVVRSDEDSKAVKSWLCYGNRQRLRFWPEQLVWFIPRLFVKSKLSGYKFAQKLYSNDYKHGFCVHLNDPVFDKYYKILTSWTHQSVNYRRTKWQRTLGIRYGFRDFVEDQMTGQHVRQLIAFWETNGYSSDDILDDISSPDLAEDSNIYIEVGDENESLNVTVHLINFAEVYQKQPEAQCNADHPLEIWQCQTGQQMIQYLELFQSENFQVDAGNVLDFDESAIIQGLDHLGTVHHLFSTGNKLRIRNYFERQLRCGLGTECIALTKHCSRRRELEDGLESSLEDNAFDKVDSLLAVTEGALCSAHCYLLHSDETLYRMSGQSESAPFELNPFSTAVVEEDDDEQKGDDAPPAIDFGEHALQWLPFGVLPLFKSFLEEMVMNPASTLSPELLDQYRMECVAKLDGKQWTEDNLDELLCLKLYTDCTKLQNLFRRAYWKRTPVDTKRSFYQWALKMYQTFLFHAQPIPKFQSEGSPKTLYHGLNKLFQVDSTTPTYQGPFSTTDSPDVAYGFADGQGLIFSVKGSYSNPIRFILGIDMVRISCFKHEREILLYSQTLPIKSTETFVEDDETMVDHLMHSLKSRMDDIVDKDSFYRKIGMEFKEELLPLILEHPILMERTDRGKRQLQNSNETILHRLVNELLVWSSSVVDILPLKSYLVFNGATIRLNDEFNLTAFSTPLQDILRDLRFTVRVNGVTNHRNYTFEDTESFRVPVVSPVFDFIPSGTVITLFSTQRDDSSAPFPFWRISCHHLFSQYVLESSNPLQIDSKLQVAPYDDRTGDYGTIYIQNNSDILVTENGEISADGAGLKTKDQCTDYDQYVQWKNQQRNDDKLNILLSFGTSSDSARTDGSLNIHGGGGMIAIRSLSDITNRGILSSNGSVDDRYAGGSISLCADGAVANHGKIECEPKGRIIVQCNEFVNDGVISPEPEVLITDVTEQREIEMIMMPWIGRKVVQIALSIYNHRGHLGNFDSYHPRNLLDGKGTDSCYMSDDTKPAVGDWIIFKVESEKVFIPKLVVIRNENMSFGLKSIEISLGRSGDAEDFEKYAVIPLIHKDNKEKQVLMLQEVQMSNVTVLMNDYKFIKLTVIENWGYITNSFLSFSIHGVDGLAIE